MSVLSSKEFLESVEEMAFAMLKDQEDRIIRDMINAKGLAYGDVELNRSDRILKFMQDEQDGVNEALRLSEPDEYEKRLRQFQKDAQEEGLV